MGEKQCGTCGEMVDEAKAFCPGCGTSFVEEKQRTSVSDFDLSDNTVRLGDTMYNQMLSDMGLSISKLPSRDRKSEEKIAPAVAAIPVSSPKPSAKASPAAPAKRNRAIMIIIGIAVVGIAIVAAIVIVAAAVLYFR
jgi:hypothetical protein